MLRNDIRYGYRGIVRSVIIFAIMLAVAVVINTSLQGAMGQIEEWVTEWPVELLALCGVTKLGVKSLNITPFYMAVIIINIVAMCRCASVAVDSMVEDMENGRIKQYINQPFNRGEIYWMKLVVAVFTAIVHWTIYFFMLSLATTMVCRIIDMPKSYELADMRHIFIDGMIYVVVLFCICLLYCMHNRRSMTNGSFLTLVCSASFFIGNMYKIFDLVGYYMRRLQIDDKTIALLSERTERLRFVFPFTLLNPLNSEKHPLPENIDIFYIFVIVGIFILCRYIFGKKDFS